MWHCPCMICCHMPPACGSRLVNDDNAGVNGSVRQLDIPAPHSGWMQDCNAFATQIASPRTLQTPLHFVQFLPTHCQKDLNLWAQTLFACAFLHLSILLQTAAGWPVQSSHNSSKCSFFCWIIYSNAQSLKFMHYVAMGQSVVAIATALMVQTSSTKASLFWKPTKVVGLLLYVKLS